EVALRALERRERDGNESAAARRGEARRAGEEAVAASVERARAVERPTPECWPDRAPILVRRELDARMPRPARRELDVEADASGRVGRWRARLSDTHGQPANERPDAAVALMIEMVRGAIREHERAVEIPAPLEATALAACAADLSLVGEVGIHLDLQPAAARLRHEAREVQVLVHSAADEARDAQLDRLLRDLRPRTILAVGPPDQVVAERGVLFDVRDRDLERRRAVHEHAPAGEQTRLVHVEPVLVRGD